VKPGKRSLFQKLKIEAHAAWLAARDPRCPWPARLVGFAVAAYALSPIDLIPDFVPVLGLVDDALIVPAGLWLFRRLLPPGLLDEHRAAAEAASERPRSRAGLIIVLAIWVVLAVLGWQVLRWAYA
jgi:uncharacterized membrane protein YkvA (DUF1232 family)